MVRSDTRTLPAKPLTAAGAKKCHDFETDLGDIAERQAKNRRSTKINMSRGLRPYRAIRLADLTAARERTIVVLGHEHDGIPDDAMELIDVAVEIPVIGTGASLNVAVAGSLVLYWLAGFL